MVPCFPVSLVKNSTFDVSEPVFPPKKSFLRIVSNTWYCSIKTTKEICNLNSPIESLKGFRKNCNGFKVDYGIFYAAISYIILASLKQIHFFCLTIFRYSSHQMPDSERKYLVNILARKKILTLFILWVL